MINIHKSCPRKIEKSVVVVGCLSLVEEPSSEGRLERLHLPMRCTVRRYCGLNFRGRQQHLLWFCVPNRFPKHKLRMGLPSLVLGTTVRYEMPHCRQQSTQIFEYWNLIFTMNDQMRQQRMVIATIQTIAISG